MIWLTEIRAINPQSGEISDWCGPRIEASSLRDAENYCSKNGLGYCRVIGKMDEISEIIEDSCQN